MLNLGGMKDLARSLQLDSNYIAEVLDDFETFPDSLVQELTLWNSDPTKKPRQVISVRKRWRIVQQKIYSNLLLPHFKPSRYSHGGVRKRSPATNAKAHLGNRFAFVADISNFFPSITCTRVNRLFLDQACSYEVARYLTRLCTYDFHLALGLTTSPIIANHLFHPIDCRIADACKRMDLSYSRFVDDITISGNYDLQFSGIQKVVTDIIGRYRFKLAENKTAWGRFDDKEFSVTGIRLKGNHLDASYKFITELDRMISDHESLSKDGSFEGPLLTGGEMFGKAHFACHVNPGRRRSILSRLRGIDWLAVRENALERELCYYRSRLEKRGLPRPDCKEPVPLSVLGQTRSEDFEDNAFDPNIAPFGDEIADSFAKVATEA